VAVKDVMFLMVASILDNRVSIGELLVLRPMTSQCSAKAAYRRGCIVWDVEPSILAVFLGSVLLQCENVRRYNERTQQRCSIERHRGVLQILNLKSMLMKI